jgi:hypothetical protein
MATTAYLDIDQGSDFVTEMTLENDDNTPMNISGLNIRSQFRKSYNSLIGYDFAVNITSPLQGKFTLSLSGIASSAIKPGRYLYDVELYGAISKTRVVEGVITINPEITKI